MDACSLIRRILDACSLYGLHLIDIFFFFFFILTDCFTKCLYIKKSARYLIYLHFIILISKHINRFLLKRNMKNETYICIEIFNDHLVLNKTYMYICLWQLRRRCQRNKGWIIWYDQCFLDVSTINRRSPRKIDYENTFSMHNPNNVSGHTQLFKKEMGDFLYKLISKANRLPNVGEEPIYYAGGGKRLGTKKVYAMMQCAQDIALCPDCLKWSISELSKCCGGKQGARVLSTTCNLRYELYPFLRT